MRIVRPIVSRFFGSVTPAPPILATGVTIDQEYANVSIGQGLPVTCTVSPDDATDKTVILVSSAPSVVSVASSGLGWIITGVSAGFATITATDSAGNTDHLDLWVVATEVSVSIVTNLTAGTGPLFVHFDASGTVAPGVTANPFRDLLYRWNFGDEDVTTWDVGARPGELKKNRFTGPIAGHVYETPGTYTATLSVYDGANWTTATTEITVADPAVVYAGSKTICVSSTGLPVAGVGGVPAGAQCFQLGTVELALAKIAGTDNRLLFKRGDTFTSSGTTYAPNFTGITIGAYGTGAKPIVNLITSTSNYSAVNLVAQDGRIMDLAFTTSIPGLLAPSQVALVGSNPLGASVFIDGQPLTTSETRIESNTHVFTATLDGYTSATLSVYTLPYKVNTISVSSSGGALTLTNSTTTRPQYAARPIVLGADNCLILRTDGTYVSTIAFIAGQHCGVVSCTLTAPGGNQGNVGLWYANMGKGGAVLGNSIVDCRNIEHGVRTHASSSMVFAYNYFAIPADGKHHLTVRGVDNLPNPEIWTEFMTVSDNQFGYDVDSGGSLQVAPEATSFNEPIRDVIIERNVFTDSCSILDPGPRLAFRNNLARFTSAVSSSNSLVQLVHSNIDGSPVPDDIAIQNNSVWNAPAGGFSLLATYKSGALAAPTNVSCANNLAYAPNATKNSSGNGVPNVVNAYLVTVAANNNSSDSQVKTVAPGWTTQPPVVNADFALTAGSYAKDAGVSGVVLEDFFGTLRTGTMDVGAVVG